MLRLTGVLMAVSLDLNVPKRVTLSATIGNVTEVSLPAFANTVEVQFLSAAGKIAWSGTDGAAIGTAFQTYEADTLYRVEVFFRPGQTTVQKLYLASAGAGTVVELRAARSALLGAATEGGGGGGGGGGVSDLQGAYVGGASITTTGNPITFNLSSGGFTANGAGSVDLGYVGTNLTGFDVGATDARFAVTNSFSVNSLSAIAIGQGDASSSIVIGKSGSATKTIEIGSLQGSTSLTLTTGNTAGPFAVNSGGILDLNAAGAVTIDSSGATIGIGTDAVAQAINIGTGAAARKLTLGNTTGASEVEVNTGSVGFDVNAGGPVAIDGSGASNLSIASGDLTLATTTSGTLGLSSAGDLTFSDQYKAGSTYGGAFKFSSSSSDYSTFDTNFGEISLLAAVNQIKSAGKILQVVHASTTTEVNILGVTAWTDTTLTATITPSSTSSKVLILVSQFAYTENGTNGIGLSNGGAAKLVRGATDIWIPWTNASGPVAMGTYLLMVSATIDLMSTWGFQPIIYLDAPNTVAPTTYKTQGRAQTTNHRIIFQPSAGGGTSNGRSDIVLIEVAG